MKIVVALGGNALLRRGEPLSADVQRANVAVAADAIAALAREHDIVVTHGNGPQIGLLALQSETSSAAPPYPLDLLGAESEGMIGYLIEQALQNRLPSRQVVSLLTRVEVRGEDTAFHKPSKPIGPTYGEAEAITVAQQRGWTVAPDGAHWRRVVASPEPVRILELPAISLLQQSGAIVVCAGGGGIPVIRLSSGYLRGVEAVVDKDLTAALLAHGLGADALLLLTDVDAAYAGWGTPHARAIGKTGPQPLRKMSFAPGSMGPKVEAACRFVESGGSLAAIGRMQDALALLNGRCGTVVRINQNQDC